MIVKCLFYIVILQLFIKLQFASVEHGHLKYSQFILCASLRIGLLFHIFQFPWEIALTWVHLIVKSRVSCRSMKCQLHILKLLAASLILGFTWLWSKRQRHLWYCLFTSLFRNLTIYYFLIYSKTVHISCYFVCLFVLICCID